MDNDSRFAPTSVLQTLPPAGIAPLDSAYAPLWRQIGAESCRVSLIDLAQRTPLASRFMVGGGNSGGVGLDQSLDSTFGGAAALIDRLAARREQPPGEVMAQMLSPRRWIYMWRVNDHLGVLAQVRHTEGHTAASVFDSAAVRLLCEHWLAPTLGAGRSTTTPWDHTERRTRAPAPLVLWAVLSSLLVCVAFGLWLLLGAASTAAQQAATQQAEVRRLGTLAESLLVHGISTALMANDYGELQQSLTEQASLKHFSAAVVVNARGQVVAQEGLAPPLRIGDALPAEVATRMRSLPLTAAGQAQGQLLVTTPIDTQSSVAGRVGTLRGAGVALCLVALAGAALLILHLRRRVR